MKILRRIVCWFKGHVPCGWDAVICAADKGGFNDKGKFVRFKDNELGSVLHVPPMACPRCGKPEMMEAWMLYSIIKDKLHVDRSQENHDMLFEEMVRRARSQYSLDEAYDIFPQGDQ